jgi:mannosyltransferase
MKSAALRRLLPTGTNLRSALPWLAVLLASSAVRLWNLGTQSLWFDETYTVFVARKSPDAMLRYLITDGVHPPLYYGLMALWIRVFGTSPVALRLPSAIAGVLSVGLMYLLVRKMAGKPEATLAALLLGFSPFFIWYSQDARMYALDGLAAIAAVYSFRQLIVNPSGKNFFWVLLAHAVLYGLHYFGVFLLLAEICFLILFRRKYGASWKFFLPAQIAGLLPLAWWIGILLRRANGSFGIGWIPKPAGWDPILTVVNFFFANSGVWSIAAVIGAAVVGTLLILSLFIGESKEAVWFGWLWLVIPILIVWILSQSVPVYIDRYLILTLPAAILLVSLGAGRIRGPANMVLPGIIVLLMAGAIWNLNLPADGFHKEEWREAAETIRGDYRPQDLILLRVYQEIVPFEYYGVLNLSWKPLEINGQSNLADIAPPGGRCILVYWLPAQTAHSFGADLPAGLTESNPAIQEWIAKFCGAQESRNAYHGIFIVWRSRNP